MILQGNQRGGAKELVQHLLKEENDVVKVHEFRGFVSDDLSSALNESYAVSRGTRAKKFLFSLSLNPPANENVSIATFIETIERIEDKLGLADQPRAIVFHEKNDRRHCHAVWSRIDADAMKALPLPHTKLKLMDISREIYLEQGWKMPQGFVNKQERDPHNFTLAQWQQSKRIGTHPHMIKRTIKESWASSDTQENFAQASKAQGYVLANGRRSPVVIDQYCEIYAVSRWTGLKAKEIRTKVSEPDKLDSAEAAKQKIAKDMAARLAEAQKQSDAVVRQRAARLEEKQESVRQQHQAQTDELKRAHIMRSVQEEDFRQTQFRQGWRGLLNHVTGKHKDITKQNQQKIKDSNSRDQVERDDLTITQGAEEQKLERRKERLEKFRTNQRTVLTHDLNQYREIQQGKREKFEHKLSNNSENPKLTL